MARMTISPIFKSIATRKIVAYESVGTSVTDWFVAMESANELVIKPDRALRLRQSNSRW